MAVVFALRAPAADLNILDNNMKSMYVDDTGLPYFSEMDSYYNLRLTENFVDHGYAGDVMYDNGTQMDFHRLAPDGTEMNYEMGIVYVTSFFILHFSLFFILHSSLFIIFIHLSTFKNIFLFIVV